MTNIKVFKPVKAPDKVLVSIRKYNLPTGHIILVGGTIEECSQHLQEILKPYISPFKNGNRVTTELREFINGKNGRTMSFSFYSDDTPGEIQEFFELKVGEPISPGEAPPWEDLMEKVEVATEVKTNHRTRRGPSQRKKDKAVPKNNHQHEEEDDSPI